MKTLTGWLTAAFVLLNVAGASAADALEIKLATILPRGLAQDAVLRKLEQDWRKASGDTIHLRQSPGGQKDGEAGIVKKLRSGNYQAALLSAVGLSEIETNVAVLQKMPLVFQNWEEVDYIREKVRPQLEKALGAKGFVVLFWADCGWVNFFSKKPATTPAEFKRMKMFAWSGESSQLEIMKSVGYQPVSLETDNIHSSFATGMIEAAPITPTFALGVQIPSVAPYLLEINWAPIVGAAIIRKDVWDKIPADLQARLRGLCEQAGRDIRMEGRRFHQQAIETLRKGPNTHVRTPTAQELAQWERLSQQINPLVRGRMVPAGIYDDVQQQLKDFRASRTGAVESAGVAVGK